MISRTSWMWICGTAVLTAAAFLACGGPTPIPGSTNNTGTGAQGGTGTGIDLTPKGNGTNTGTSTGPVTVSEADGGNCGITTNSLTQVPADLLLVLDRSSSMSYSLTADSACGGGGTCTTRWATMTTALNQVLTTSPTGVQWGLKFFTSPGGSRCTVNAGADVPIPATAAQVQAAITPLTPANQTPTTAAINAAVAYYGTVNDGRSHNILLATDGEPNCDPGTSSTVSPTTVANTAAAIKVAFDAGIKTYVIGIGPSPGNLTSFALNGGTTDFFPATSPDQLVAALNNIAVAVASCVFSLGKAPPDPGNVAVEFDGNSSLRAPRDINQVDGWNYTSPANTTIQLFGSWCQKVTDGTYKSAKILMGCPGQINF
jgi:hypothetical protein